MKNGRKFITIILCVFLAAALCLSACKKADDAPEDDKKTQEQAKKAEKEEDKDSDGEDKDGMVQEESREETKDAKKPNIPSPSVSGKLSVSGTQLVDENGQVVQLRGLSTHGMAWFPQYINEELFGQFHEDWKANVIRLAMYTAESGGYCTDGDKENLKNLIRNGVEYATKHDMYVIVDWHILSDNNPNMHKAEAVEFFAQMTKEFSDHDNVIYEICNEPNGGTSWAEIKAYAQEVIPVIRANAPDAVILVGTPNWSQYVNEAAADPITGYDNIMYTLHFYAATHTDSLRNTMAAAIDAGLPVFVSEYGICDASGNGGIDEAQANAWVQVMDQYKVSYVAWNISNKNETSAIIRSGVDKTSGLTWDDLSDSGRWLYQVLTRDGSEPGGNGTTTSAGGSSGAAGGNDATVNGNGGAGNNRATNGDAGNGAAGGSSGSGSSNAAVRSGDIEATATLANSWESNGQKFYQYTLTIKNTSSQACQSWAVDVKFNGDISLSDGWNGQYSAEGDTLHISSVDYNGKLDAGGSTGDVGFIISGKAGLEIQ
jgi:endoglucanase